MQPVGWLAAVAGGTTVAGYVSVYPVSLGGGQTEPIACALALGALVLVLRPVPSLPRAALAGALAGAAILTSIVAAPAFVALCVVLASSGSGGLRRLTSLVAGGLATAVAVASALWAAGILPDAWNSIVEYNAAYAALNRPQIGQLGETIAISIVFLAPLLVPCAVGLARWMRAPTATPVSVAATVWAVTGGLAIVASGRLVPHYLVMIIPPIVLVAVPSTREMLHAGRHRMAGTALLAAAALLAAPALGAFAAWSATLTDQPKVREVATWLDARASGSDRLFVWGNEPELYYGSGLTPATRFVYVMPLLTPGYGSPSLSEGIARDLAANPPAFVVDAGSSLPGQPGIVPLLVPRPVFVGDGRTFDTIEPIRDVIRKYYGPPIEVAGWLIYERTGGLPVH